jgi:hypothetical protein
VAMHLLFLKNSNSMDSSMDDSDISLSHVPPQYTLYLNTTILTHGPVNILDKTQYRVTSSTECVHFYVLRS